MQDLHGALGDVAVLSARTGTPARGPFEIPIVQTDLDIRGFDENRDRHRGCLDAPSLFVRGDALPPMAAGLVLEETRGGISVGSEDDEPRTLLYDLKVKDRGALRASRRPRTARSRGSSHLGRLRPPGSRR